MGIVAGMIDEIFRGVFRRSPARVDRLMNIP
jgi:hypothetical protein